jgi:hypothetical protein
MNPLPDGVPDGTHASVTEDEEVPQFFVSNVSIKLYLRSALT